MHMLTSFKLLRPRQKTKFAKMYYVPDIILYYINNLLGLNPCCIVIVPKYHKSFSTPAFFLINCEVKCTSVKSQ